VNVSGLGIDESGIAQGMSGSPVYLSDGRLIGALAFAFSFALEPIAGVTPIGEMYDIVERNELEKEAARTGVLIPAPRDGERSRLPDPIAMPLTVSGFDPRLAAEVEAFFEPYGMVATAGGSGAGGGDLIDWSPRPGAAVGVRLLGGDATLAGIGTVTWVDGDRVLAFGHPMFQAGRVNLPLVSAEVHTLIPSRFVSFKLGSPIEEIGALVQDRRPGVLGDLSARAPTIPVDVVVDIPGVERHEYHYDAMDDKRLTPFLVSWAVQNSVLYREQAIGEGTVQARVFVDLEGTDDLVRENVYASTVVLRDLGDDILFPLQVLENNPLARADIVGIQVEVTATTGRRSARIEEIELEKGRLRPGETVRGSVTLRHYQGETETRRFALPLPPDAAEGKLLLRVCDAASSEEWDSKRSPHRFATKEIGGLVRILRDLRTNEGIYVQLFGPERGVTIDGREMPLLPESRIRVIGAPLHADDGDYVSGRVVASETIRLDAFITGCKALPIYVDRSAP